MKVHPDRLAVMSERARMLREEEEAAKKAEAERAAAGLVAAGGEDEEDADAANAGEEDEQQQQAEDKQLVPRAAAGKKSSSSSSLQLGGKKMGALMERWSAARAEADADEWKDAKEAAGPSIAQLEQRKRQRVSEWRAGLTPGDLETNNNFAPLGRDDWQERVKRARQEH